MKLKKLRTLIGKRLHDVLAYLEENYPSINQEQYHLDEGTIERGYWHYGYCVALKDILNKLQD